MQITILDLWDLNALRNRRHFPFCKWQKVYLYQLEASWLKPWGNVCGSFDFRSLLDPRSWYILILSSWCKDISIKNEIPLQPTAKCSNLIWFSTRLWKRKFNIITCLVMRKTESTHVVFSQLEGEMKRHSLTSAWGKLDYYFTSDPWATSLTFNNSSNQ